MPMNEEQIKAAIVRILELPEHQGAWYGAADKAPRNTRGNGVFDAIKEIAAVTRVATLCAPRRSRFRLRRLAVIQRPQRFVSPDPMTVVRLGLTSQTPSCTRLPNSQPYCQPAPRRHPTCSKACLPGAGRAGPCRCRYGRSLSSCQSAR